VLIIVLLKAEDYEENDGKKFSKIDKKEKYITKHCILLDDIMSSMI